MPASRPAGPLIGIQFRPAGVRRSGREAVEPLLPRLRLSCRVAVAGLTVTEVPSVERQRIFGQTNLRTFADGTRVLRTLVVERFGGRRDREPPVLAPVVEL